MQDALLSIEDSRFYQHGALDLKGTLRALVNNASEAARRKAARRSRSSSSS